MRIEMDVEFRISHPQFKLKRSMLFVFPDGKLWFMFCSPKKRKITHVEGDESLILRQNTPVFKGNTIRLGNHLKGVKG
jgi:hypothetical protein